MYYITWRITLDYSFKPGTHKNEPADALAVVVVRPPLLVGINRMLLAHVLAREEVENIDLQRIAASSPPTAAARARFEQQGFEWHG